MAQCPFVVAGEPIIGSMQKVHRSPYSLSLGDLNGDSLDDLAATAPVAFEQNNLAVLLGTGTTTGFQPAQYSIFCPGCDECIAVAARDCLLESTRQEWLRGPPDWSSDRLDQRPTRHTCTGARTGRAAQLRAHLLASGGEAHRRPLESAPALQDRRARR